MRGGWLFWLLAGLLIGFIAARRRGWSPVAGLLGGALLGPLAFGLFLVSSAGDDRSVVRQTGRGILIALGLAALAFGALILYGYLGGFR